MKEVSRTFRLLLNNSTQKTEEKRTSELSNKREIRYQALEVTIKCEHKPFNTQKNDNLNVRYGSDVSAGGSFRIDIEG